MIKVCGNGIARCTAVERVVCVLLALGLASVGMAEGVGVATETNAERERAIRIVAAAWHTDAKLLSARPRDNQFFKHWTIWRVEDDSLPPSVAFAATGGNEARVLDGMTALSEIARNEPVRVQTPDDAVRYVTFLFSLTHRLADVIGSVNAVPEISDKDRAAWKSRIAPPAVEAHEGKQRVRIWLFDNGDLIEATLDVGADGTVAGSIVTRATGVGRVHLLD